MRSCPDCLEEKADSEFGTRRHICRRCNGDRIRQAKAGVRKATGRPKNHSLPPDADVNVRVSLLLANRSVRSRAATALVRMTLLAMAHPEVRAKYPRAVTRCAMACESVLSGDEFPSPSFYR